MTDPARVQAIRSRLDKCSGMLRDWNPQLWTNVSEKGLAHRRVCDDPYHGGCNILQSAEAMDEARDLLASLHQEQERLRSALERTREYIRLTMKPESVKAACGETAYDRAERRGLQHALNAIDHEFAEDSEGSLVFAAPETRETP